MEDELFDIKQGPPEMFTRTCGPSPPKNLPIDCYKPLLAGPKKWLRTWYVIAVKAHLS